MLAELVVKPLSNVEVETGELTHGLPVYRPGSVDDRFVEFLLREKVLHLPHSSQYHLVVRPTRRALHLNTGGEGDLLNLAGYHMVEEEGEDAVSGVGGGGDKFSSSGITADARKGELSPLRRTHSFGEPRSIAATDSTPSSQVRSTNVSYAKRADFSS